MKSKLLLAGGLLTLPSKLASKRWSWKGTLSLMIGIKSLSRRTKITEENIRDGVAKRDGLGILKN